MKTPLCLFMLVVAGIMLPGCASKKTSVSDSMALSGADEAEERNRDGMTPAERFAYDYRSAAMARMQEDELPVAKGFLIQTAKTALGTPYVLGGTDREGFDCSGFVQWAYKHVGIKLPRTAREQASVGKLIRDSSDLSAGDIVAFRHPRRGYHTGIYVGDGKFIHSPRRRQTVRINSLDDPYFSSTFLGARRVRATSEAEEKAAQKLLAMYEAGKLSRQIKTDGSISRSHQTKSKKLKTERKKKTTAARSSKSSRQEKIVSKRSVSKASKAKSSKKATVASQKNKSQKVAIRKTSQTSKKKLSTKKSS